LQVPRAAWDLVTWPFQAFLDYALGSDPA
jgi:hypothetical protein